MICRKEILVNTYTALTNDRKFSTHAQRIQGDFALNQFEVHLALVTRSIAGPGNQATIVDSCMCKSRDSFHTCFIVRARWHSCAPQFCFG